MNTSIQDTLAKISDIISELDLLCLLNHPDPMKGRTAGGHYWEPNVSVIELTDLSDRRQLHCHLCILDDILKNLSLNTSIISNIPVEIYAFLNSLELLRMLLPLHQNHNELIINLFGVSFVGEYGIGNIFKMLDYIFSRPYSQIGMVPHHAVYGVYASLNFEFLTRLSNYDCVPAHVPNGDLMLANINSQIFTTLLQDPNLPKTYRFKMSISNQKFNDNILVMHDLIQKFRSAEICTIFKAINIQPLITEIISYLLPHNLTLAYEYLMYTHSEKVAKSTLRIQNWWRNLSRIGGKNLSQVSKEDLP